MRKFSGISASVLLLAASVGGRPSGWSAEATSQPSTIAPRGHADVEADLVATMNQLLSVFPSLRMVGDVEARTAPAPKAIPLFRKASQLFSELAATQSDPEEKAGLIAQGYQMKSMAIALGDDDTVTALKAEGGDLHAKTALALGDYWRHADDASAQSKVLAGLVPLADANAADGDLADAISNMFHVGAADYSVKKQVIDIARTHLNGDPARDLVRQGEALAKMKALEGHPLSVVGRTIDGGSFSSETLKGKVVMVDFWATWCVPCRDLIPEAKKLYQELHPKGFEIVGVDSNDNDAAPAAFIKDNAMPWPQLRETSQNPDEFWHPLTRQWSIKTLPAVFLVDKKGILRDVEGDYHTAAKVRKLLAE